METPSTLWDLLLHAAKLAPNNGLIFQEDGIDGPTLKLAYHDLISKSTFNAKRLIACGALKPGQIVGTYFSTHKENIEWCWSVIAAGGIPVILSSLSNDPVTLKGQLGNISGLFEQPTVFTAQRLKPAFQEAEGLNLVAVEQLPQAQTASDVIIKPSENGDDLAILLLTSGSTGHSKAVSYSHSQLLASVRAKAAFHKTDHRTNFMSWISFDHSANFCEVHINAMYTCSNQVHVSTSDLVTHPDEFFRLLSKHETGYTFLPNFFLAAAVKAFNGRKDKANLDLSRLRVIMCGGEANRTATIAGAEHVLTQFGAPPNSIKAAYGLSETCSAAFYNTAAPSYDIQNEYIFASVGKHIPDAISMRIVDDDGREVGQGGSGAIHLRGPMVFGSYYNNPSATKSCMTEDGWFDTGDLGTLDTSGNLRIVGRRKEIIILNGNNYSSFDIEHAIESSGISGLTTSYTAAFSMHDENSESESVVILFNPTDNNLTPESQLETIERIDKTVLRVCSQRAMAIIPLPKDQLPKSTIGKLSRAKLKTAYQAGQFDKFRVIQKSNDSAYASDSDDGTSELSKMGREILDIFADNAKVPKSVLAGPDGLFSAGVDSIGYMRIKKSLEKVFNIDQEFPMVMLMRSHSVQALEEALYSIGTVPSYYDPIVPLCTKGSKSSLFLFHPGAGEFLCWVPFLKYLPDRPIYALRSKGLNKNEGTFSSLDEMLDSYQAAIKRVQPEGPYAFLGYCFGGMLAFEVAKRFEAAGDEMAFISGIDNPPHLKKTMGQLRHRTLMLDLLPVLLPDYTAEDAEQFIENTNHFTDDEFYSALFQKFSPEFIEQMDLTPARLTAIGRVEDAMRLITSTYDPSGSISKFDVFAANPMPHFNATPEEWKTGVLGTWGDFVTDRGEVRIHPVGGNHSTVIKEPYIRDFQVTLNSALEGRGI